MSVFKRFGPGDQVDNVLVLEPAWDLASGSSGWKGSPEGSASVSLYGGHHRKTAGVVQEYRYQPTIPGIASFGQLARSGPITASVNFVYATDNDLSLIERSSTRWGYNHWKTIMRLYEHYHVRDPDYVTSSYDYYCIYFNKDSRNTVLLSLSTGSATIPPIGSFTLESWAKPFQTASSDQDFTLQSYNPYFWFGVTGSTGKLSFSSSLGLFSAAVGPTPGVWQHMAVTFNSASLTGTFYLDLVNVGTFEMSSSLVEEVGVNRQWTVGNQLSASSAPNEYYSDTGHLKRSFHGFIGDSRVWSSHKTWSELSESHNRRLYNIEVNNENAPLGNLQFNDGPLSVFKYPGVFGFPTVAGSGAINNTSAGDVSYARFRDFDDRQGPVWHPNDNIKFYPPKQFVRKETVGRIDQYVVEVAASEDVSKLRVISVPAGMFGRRIKPGSVVITDRAFSDSSYGIVRTLVDDTRGGLFLSGSACSLTNSDASVNWNKVGNVFYDEGLIVIKDTALLDFGASWSVSSADPADLIQLSFRGESRIPVKTLMCRIDRGDLNASLNSTFWNEEEDGSKVRRFPDGNLYITAVGIYNSDRELVGVAKLAEPVRVRQRDRMNIKIRMDF